MKFKACPCRGCSSCFGRPHGGWTDGALCWACRDRIVTRKAVLTRADIQAEVTTDPAVAAAFRDVAEVYTVRPWPKSDRRRRLK